MMLLNLIKCRSRSNLKCRRLIVFSSLSFAKIPSDHASALEILRLVLGPVRRNVTHLGRARLTKPPCFSWRSSQCEEYINASENLAREADLQHSAQNAGAFLRYVACEELFSFYLILRKLSFLVFVSTANASCRASGV